VEVDVVTSIAIVGCHGLVGRNVLALIEAGSLPIEQLTLVGSPGSRGSTCMFNGREVPVQAMTDVDFATIDVAILAAGRDVSLRHAEAIAGNACIVIDGSSAFRERKNVPLVIPELNGDTLRMEDWIIASPNCIAIQLALALAPLEYAFGLERIDVATWQAASGAGQDLVNELESGDSSLAGNILPCIGELDEHGCSEEERKIQFELPRLLETPGLPVAVTATRVPVLNGHSAAVHLRLHNPASPGRIAGVLKDAPAVRYIDARARPGGPTPLGDASGQDDVLVGRIRVDLEDPRHLQMWVVADNLRRGAALNTVLILEKVISLHRLNAKA
jgi:aspartate-semialdehyde dehydrogenase